jgi:hypothetical protein
VAWLSVESELKVKRMWNFIKDREYMYEYFKTSSIKMTFLFILVC